MLQPFKQGVRDSLKVWYSLTLLYQSSRIKKLAKQPFLVAGTFAFIHVLIMCLLSNQHAQYKITLVFYTYPVYILAILTNAVYQTRMLNLLYSYQAQLRGDRPKPFDFKNNIVELVYGHLILLGFTLQITTIQYFTKTLPIINVLANILLTIPYSWFFSFYLYEYKLIYNSQKIQQRVRYFETRWLYFSGFGAIFAILYQVTPFYVSTSFYLLYLNLLILNTIHLNPMKTTDPMPKKMHRLAIFYFPLHFSNTIVRIYRFLQEKSHGKTKSS
jgi:hypothetical protein